MLTMFAFLSHFFIVTLRPQNQINNEDNEYRNKQKQHLLWLFMAVCA